MADTFPEAETKVLCQLAEMTEISPSKVLEIVPGATAAQIAGFLRIAEAQIDEEKDRDRQVPPVDPSKGVASGYKDKIALLGQVENGPAADPKEGPALDCPTDEKSEFMKELKKLVPQKDGGSDLASVQFSEQFQKKILNLLEVSNSSASFDAEHFEQIFQKLQKDPLARTRLENLHAARAHKYGHAHFGPKSLYKESTNVAKKFKSQAERQV